MKEHEALKIAKDYLKAKGTVVGELEHISLMRAEVRPDDKAKGDLWRVFFKCPTPQGLFTEPDVVIDSTGDVSEFDAM